MAESKPPTARQLRYLRGLAEACGESFVYPRSSRQASREIERLRRRPLDGFADRRRERLQISRDLAERPDSAAVRDSEIVGYGSSARWR